ncbi:hypothetical protein BDZ94DRAFT_1173972 [Collybia nuda]|uniref:Uncharacterized protein n=1 Tax=Collybia nuda TaxID=64659 RepID=A0A9P5XV26_9AGAR|nr:hypothetical protein BDZ94DRAFT_1173972 [Collybia nuda]
MLRYSFLTRIIGFSSLALAGPLTIKQHSIQWINCSSNIPQPLQGVALPCTLPSTLHCGKIDVPMDYTKPIGPDNMISLGFSMYRPEKPIGLINFFGLGGPNAETASYGWALALNLTQAAPLAGLENFDVLALDSRGTFQSNALNCTIGDYVVPPSFPSNEAEFSAYQAAVTKFANSCSTQTKPEGILAHLSTNEAIQDWDLLRAALGYDTMHALTWSYGTFGAVKYAKMFPKNVGRFVLDGIIPPGLDNFNLVDQQIVAVNRLLLRADAFCINDAACPFHTAGKGSVPQAFNTILDRAIAGDYPNITSDDVRAMVYLAYLSSSPNFTALNGVLAAALNNDTTGLTYSAFGPIYTPGFLPVLQTICLDQTLQNNTFAGFDSLRQRISQNDTAQIQYSQILSLMGLCGGWPYKAKSNVALKTDIPMLLLTSDFDLNTPTEGSTFEFQQTSKSTLVVRHGDGHVTSLIPGPARSAAFSFLTTGVFPTATNQSLVSVFPPGTPRDPISDPYVVPIGPNVTTAEV